MVGERKMCILMWSALNQSPGGVCRQAAHAEIPAYNWACIAAPCSPFQCITKCLLNIGFPVDLTQDLHAMLAWASSHAGRAPLSVPLVLAGGTLMMRAVPPHQTPPSGCCQRAGR
jgi:hypothetical protein